MWPGCGLILSTCYYYSDTRKNGVSLKDGSSRNRYSKKQMMGRGGMCKGYQIQSQEIDAAKRQRVSTSFKKEMQDIKQLSFFFSSSAKASHH